MVQIEPRGASQQCSHLPAEWLPSLMLHAPPVHVVVGETLQRPVRRPCSASAVTAAVPGKAAFACTAHGNAKPEPAAELAALTNSNSCIKRKSSIHAANREARRYRTATAACQEVLACPLFVQPLLFSPFNRASISISALRLLRLCKPGRRHGVIVSPPV